MLLVSECTGCCVFAEDAVIWLKYRRPCCVTDIMERY